MKRHDLIQKINSKKSFLCVGLDADLDKLPYHLLEEDDAVYEFNKVIVDATRDLCVAYKPNLAFYEALGERGWASLRKTIEYIGKDHLVIADAKRGDIGNTGRMYAKAFFEDLSAGAITVAPYMGKDSVDPFLGFEGKWCVILALTSNSGSLDFQVAEKGDNHLFAEVLQKSSSWGSIEDTMYVVGATRTDFMQEVRRIVPRHFLLVPGVGAQGGSLKDVANQLFVPNECGLLVNSSRGIIYAGGRGEDFAEGIRASAETLQKEMSSFF